MENFENIRIRDNQGRERPLNEVAKISHSRQLAEINRLNQKRSITVTADVDSEEANAALFVAEMQTRFCTSIFGKIQKRIWRYVDGRLGRAAGTNG